MALFAIANTDDALDVVQDAMLAFVKHYASKPATEWGALFHRTLQNRITDWHRRSSIRNRFRGWLGSYNNDDSEEDSLNNFPDTRSPDPSQELLQRDLGEAIEKALRLLPLRQQQAFLLRAWEGLDVAKTAFAMGCSEGSVKTHYFRALQALRERLGELV